MYLSHVFIENFRIFGSTKDDEHLDLALKPELNVFVGENDSGKTAIVDAIRIVLQTSSFDYYRLNKDDFHLLGVAGQDRSGESEGTQESKGVADPEERRASEFTIRCTFSGLETPEIGKYLEWLSIDADKDPALYITLRAQRRTDSQEGRHRNRFPYTVHSGKEGDGPKIEGDIREFLRVTYLKPLRDAEAELTAGRGSRLSQILENHPDFDSQRASDYDPEGDEDQVPATLLGIFRQAEDRITKNKVIDGTKATLNATYLKEFSLAAEELRGEIGVSRETELRQILEKLELWLEISSQPAGTRTRRGLGYNNILFMATELLLLGETGTDSFPMLLIEEPEAHLHPQMQLRLMAFLEQKSKKQMKADSGEGHPSVSGEADSDRSEDYDQQIRGEEGHPGKTNERGSAQVLLTTHSPNLASKADLGCMVLMCRGRTYPLDEHHTMMNPADYRFLQRFLDVTKANLFFAKGVLMVEGDAENILLPILAGLLGRSFSKHGISVVNVGHTGFFRFSRILQSNDESRPVPIQVACLADRDIVPDSAKDYVKQKEKDGEEVPTFESQLSKDETEARVRSKRKTDGGNVKTFVSPGWTLEYDLALNGLAKEVHAAVKASKKEKYQDAKQGAIVTDEVLQACRQEADEDILGWRDSGKTDADIAALVYRDLHKGNASKAVTAQMLAQILTDEKPSTGDLRTMLPNYILEAVEHLTGPGLLPLSHASQNSD